MMIMMMMTMEAANPSSHVYFDSFCITCFLLLLY